MELQQGVLRLFIYYLTVTGQYKQIHRQQTLMLQVFHCLNALLPGRPLPTLARTLDQCLTFECILSMRIWPGELGLAAGELAILRRMGRRARGRAGRGKRERDMMQGEWGQQYYQHREGEDRGEPAQMQVTAIVIHHYGPHTGDMLPSCSQLLHLIDNIIVIDTDAHTHTNLLITPALDALSSATPSIILLPPSLTATPPCPHLPCSASQQLDLYMDILQLYHSHLNIHSCLYPEAQNPALSHSGTTADKILYLMEQSEEYRLKGEDDMDVMLRGDVPEGAYMRVNGHSLEGMGLATVTANPGRYRLLGHGEEAGGWYVFQLLREGKGGQREGQKKGGNRREADGNDKEMMVWVLYGGKPSLQLLPVCLEGRRREFWEARSPMGYTIFGVEDQEGARGEDRPNPSSKQTPLNTNTPLEPSQLSCSESSCPSSHSSVTPALPQLYILNFTTPPPPEFLHQELLKLFQSFALQHRHRQQQLQVQKNMQLVQIVSRILDVQERDVYRVLCLDRL